MSRDIPIMFSAPMVQAHLTGRKTMTRRVALRPWKEVDDMSSERQEHFDVLGHVFHFRSDGSVRSHAAPSPWQRVKAGDRLWVREEWRVSRKWDATKPSGLPARTMSVMFTAGGSVANTATGWGPDLEWPPAGDFPDWAGRRRASMHMPRWASRLTLIVTSTKIEPLWNISERDAMAEGVELESADPPFYYVPGIMPHDITAVGIEERSDLMPHAVQCFRKLWIHINGREAWESNPGVVAITFRVIKANIDAPEARAA
jgi:hypothetical protein